ncbi:MAG TPA: hypothetical protein VNP04_06360 [Alphaproteobacteria bacterium]|nr:hypothetical protein [Alphaproteobacteria bacterium]
MMQRENMKVTMLLADAVQAVEGKLYILGGGWSIIGPEPAPMAIAIKVEVPWTEANKRHELQLALLDEDSQPVMVPTPIGDRPVELKVNFEVGRPPGLRVGTPLDVPLAINLGPLPLQPGHRYVWRCSVNGQSEPDWQVSFSTRPTERPTNA